MKETSYLITNFLYFPAWWSTNNKSQCSFLISTLILFIKYPFSWMQIERKPLQSKHLQSKIQFFIFKVILTKEEFIFLIEKRKKRDEGRIQIALSHFSRTGSRIDRGNRVSSRLLDPPSHNNLTQAWRVKPWPGIQGWIITWKLYSRISSVQGWFIELDGLLRTLVQKRIDPVARVPEKGKWIDGSKGIMKTNFWYIIRDNRWHYTWRKESSEFEVQGKLYCYEQLAWLLHFYWNIELLERFILKLCWNLEIVSTILRNSNYFEMSNSKRMFKGFYRFYREIMSLL